MISFFTKLFTKKDAPADTTATIKPFTWEEAKAQAEVIPKPPHVNDFLFDKTVKCPFCGHTPWQHFDVMYAYGKGISTSPHCTGDDGQNVNYRDENGLLRVRYDAKPCEKDCKLIPHEVIINWAEQQGLILDTSDRTR